jgi:hypothetical protein
VLAKQLAEKRELQKRKLAEKEARKQARDVKRQRREAQQATTSNGVDKKGDFTLFPSFKNDSPNIEPIQEDPLPKSTPQRAPLDDVPPVHIPPILLPVIAPLPIQNPQTTQGSDISIAPVTQGKKRPRSESSESMSNEEYSSGEESEDEGPPVKIGSRPIAPPRPNPNGIFQPNAQSRPIQTPTFNLPNQNLPPAIPLHTPNSTPATPWIDPSLVARAKSTGMDMASSAVRNLAYLAGVTLLAYCSNFARRQVAHLAPMHPTLREPAPALRDHPAVVRPVGAIIDVVGQDDWSEFE